MRDEEIEQLSQENTHLKVEVGRLSKENHMLKNLQDSLLTEAGVSSLELLLTKIKYQRDWLAQLVLRDAILSQYLEQYITILEKHLVIDTRAAREALARNYKKPGFGIKP